MAVYIGPGVLNFKGVDYGYGDTLPEDVDVAALKAKGKAADSVPAPPAVASLIETQAEKIKELEATVAKLQTDFETAQKTITQLMSQSAGPKK